MHGRPMALPELAADVADNEVQWLAAKSPVQAIGEYAWHKHDAGRDRRVGELFVPVAISAGPVIALCVKRVLSKSRASCGAGSALAAAAQHGWRVLKPPA